MNKRTEHDGIQNRFPQKQHTGKIPAGVGFPSEGGGGVICHLDPKNYVRIDGRIRYCPMIAFEAETEPPVGIVARLFDRDRNYLGEGEYMGFMEFSVEGEVCPDVEFYEPI